MATHETNPQQSDPNQLYPTPEEQSELAKHALIVARESHLRRNLKGTSFTGSMYSGEALAREATDDTKMEDLTHLVVVGGQFLAVTRVMEKNEDGDWLLRSVRLSKVPLGGAREAQQGTGLLKEVDIPSLKKPDASGAVTPWAESTFGREQLGAKGADGTLYIDPTVSGRHFTFRVDDKGTFSISDHSRNGTAVLDARDLIPATEEQKPLADAFGGVVATLQEYPAMW